MDCDLQIAAFEVITQTLTSEMIGNYVNCQITIDGISSTATFLI